MTIKRFSRCCVHMRVQQQSWISTQAYFGTFYTTYKNNNPAIASQVMPHQTGLKYVLRYMLCLNSQPMLFLHVHLVELKLEVRPFERCAYGCQSAQPQIWLTVACAIVDGPEQNSRSLYTVRIQVALIFLTYASVLNFVRLCASLLPTHQTHCQACSTALR